MGVIMDLASFRITYGQKNNHNLFVFLSMNGLLDKVENSLKNQLDYLCYNIVIF